MEGTYTFTGTEPELGYFHYRDLDEDRMLIAHPGVPYHIAALEPGLPVPPDDGRWDPPYVKPEPPAEDDSTPEDAAPAAPKATKGKGKASSGDTSTPAGDEGTEGGAQ